MRCHHQPGSASNTPAPAHRPRLSLTPGRCRGRSASSAREAANEHHPYDVPQVLAVPVSEAHPGYRQWVLDSTLAE
ncbi:divalent cation tolerance protein CutA [Nocardia sp. NPDC003693]